MPYALSFNGTGYVSIPSKVTADGVGFAYEFDFEIPNYTNQNLYGRLTDNSVSALRITAANTLVYRVGTGLTNTITLSSNIPLNTRVKLRFYREYAPTRNLVVTLAGAEVYRVNSATFDQAGGADDVRLIGKSSNGTFSGKVYAANINGTVYLNESSPDTSSWGDGTLTSIPSTNWTLYSDGTAPTGIVTIGTITPNSTGASVPFTYSAADQTGFEYQLNETGTIYPISASPATPAGLTPSTGYTIRVRAENDSGEGAWSAVANFTTSAAGSPPTFTVAPAVTSISTTTATVTATINETGSIYHVIVPQADATPSVAQVKSGQNSAGGATVDSGSALATTTISDPVSGLTANTPYKMCMVAEDDESPPNIQAAVTTVNFTTSAVAVGTITLTDLTSIQDVAWVSQPSITCDVINPSTGALVVRKTGLTSTAGADVVFSDAAIVAATTYDIIIRIGADEIGIARAVAT